MPLVNLPNNADEGDSEWFEVELEALSSLCLRQPQTGRMHCQTALTSRWERHVWDPEKKVIQ